MIGTRRVRSLEITYIKGCKNVAADALSRLPTETNEFETAEECFSMKDLD